MSEDIMLGNVEVTTRGFEIIKFKDNYGNNCSLQQSSLAIYEQPGTSAVRLGIDGHRMHLTLEQAQELVQVLHNWIDEGTFKSDLHPQSPQVP